ncbi:hypothetical protein [Corynebacterium sp. SCR221107]|uniref:hypothetical protein n=1 Tax=Corynebacterium sp. SCR221107 TaxID=3017361 RepID=UPI003FA42C1E
MWAGVIALAQSALGIGYAIVLIVRSFMGKTDPSLYYETENANTAVGLGTAAFLLIVFGTVIAGAIMMMRGKRWGRGPVIMLQILLLLISYYMFSGGQPLWGGLTAVTCLVGLGCSFSPLAVQWAAAQYNR